MRAILTREQAEASLASYKTGRGAMAHKRKAFAALGDDTTLTRFVRVRHDQPPRPRAISTAVITAAEQGRSLRRAPLAHPGAGMLVSGHNTVKLGRDVRKGRLKGYWIFALSLEERSTCPSTCIHWLTCYGNNMPFAKRVDHSDTMFEPELAADIERRLSVRGRVGILIRLHELGDFFSEAYVDFWRAMLARHDRLAVFGFTARKSDSPIGRAVAALVADFPDRASIRFSDGGADKGCTASIASPDDKPAGAIICPEQQGKTSCCATCALCWQTDRTIAFLSH